MQKYRKHRKIQKIQKHLRLQCENLCILPITETLAAPMWQFFTVYKHRNTCSNVTICVFCQIQRHLLLQCEIFVYFAVVTNAKVFCDHLNNEVAEFLQMTIALPRVVIYVQYLRKYQSFVFQFCLQGCYKKQKLQINPSSKQIGCSFWNTSNVDDSLVVSKSCTFLKTLFKQYSFFALLSSCRLIRCFNYVFNFSGAP